MKISNIIGLCIIVLTTLILPNLHYNNQKTSNLAYSDTLLWHAGKSLTPLR